MINEQRFGLKKNGEPNSKCFCRRPELIENYDKAITDTTQTWDCHHRMETHRRNGKPRVTHLSISDLKDWGIYYDRPAEELIFLTCEDHQVLHKKGKPLSEEHKRKISEAQKGMKRAPFSEEHNRKVSEALKGKKRPKGAGKPSKKVLCIETGEVFESIWEAYRKTGIYAQNISSVCNGKLKTAGNLHWKFYN